MVSIKGTETEKNLLRHLQVNHNGFLEVPGTCPVCAHPQGHFEVLAENW